MRLARLLLILGYLAASIQCASASATGERAGGGWVAVHLSNVTDAPFRVVLSASMDARGAFGVEVRAAAGSATSFTRGEGHRPSEAFAAPVVVHAPSIAPWHEATASRGTVYPDFDQPTSIQLLFWVAGPMSRWSWDVEYETPVALEVVATSDEYIFVDGSQPDAGWFARGAADGYAANAGNASYLLDVRREFRGVAGVIPEHIGTSLGRIDLTDASVTLTHPDGAAERCLCLDIRDPGSYRLDWRGHAVNSPDEQPIMFAGVDAPRWIGS